jgi:hypothetical protein
LTDATFATIRFDAGVPASIGVRTDLTLRPFFSLTINPDGTNIVQFLSDESGANVGA